MIACAPRYFLDCTCAAVYTPSILVMPNAKASIGAYRHLRLLFLSI